MFCREKNLFFYSCLSMVMAFCLVIGFALLTTPRALAAESAILTVPEGTEIIYKDSFPDGENAVKIVLPSSFRYGGTSKLRDLFPNLSEIEVSADNPAYASFDGMLCRKDSDGLFVLECPIQKKSVNFDSNIKGVSQYAFDSCKKINEISVGDSDIFRVKNGVLYKDKSIILAEKDISEFVLPGDEKPNTITEYAFAYCSELKSIKIPESIKTIKNYAFYGCTGLTSIKIPESVTSIGGNAFCKCSSLAKISLPDGVNYIGAEAFDKTAYYNTDSNWKNHVLYIDSHLIKADMKSLSGEYRIKDGTRTIAAYAFNGCENMTAVDIPDSVLNICSSAFKNCNNLREIKLGKRLTNLANDAFSDCRSVKEFNGDCDEYTIEDGVVYNKDKTGIFAFPLSKSWENDTFDIPSTVEHFSAVPFKRSYNVKNMTYSGNGFYVDEQGAVYETGEGEGYTLKFVPAIDSVYDAINDTKTIDCSFTGSKIEFTEEFRDNNKSALDRINNYIYDIDDLPDFTFYDTTRFINVGNDVESIKSSDTAVVVYPGTKEEAGEKFGYFASQADKDADRYSAKTLIICNPNGESLDRLLKSKNKDGKFSSSMDLDRPYSHDRVKDAIIVETETIFNYTLEITPLTLNEMNNVRMDGYQEFGFSNDITLKLDGVAITPQNPVEVYFKKDYLGYEADKLFIVHCKNDKTKETFTWNAAMEEYRIKEVIKGYDEYWMITVTSLSPFAIYTVPDISIANYQDTLSVDYKSKLTFNTYSAAPYGSKIVWTVNGIETEGPVLTIDEATEEEYRISVSIVKEEDGEVIKTSEEEVVTVKTGFFAKIVAFFRGLFRSLPEYIDNMKIIKAPAIARLPWFSDRFRIVKR